MAFHSDSSNQHRPIGRSRIALLILLAVSVAGILVGSVLVLVSVGEQKRHHTLQEFDERVKPVAVAIDAALRMSDDEARARGAHDFDGQRPDVREWTNDGIASAAALYAADGSLLAAYPSAPRRSTVTPYLRQAFRTGFATSGTVSAGGRPSLYYARRIDTPFGRRALVATVPLKTFAALIVPQLDATIEAFHGGLCLVVGPHQLVLARSHPSGGQPSVPVTPPSIPPGSGAGVALIGRRWFAFSQQPVPHIGWRVLAIAPRSQVLAAAGVSWMSWTLLAALALVTLIAGWVVSRLAHGSVLFSRLAAEQERRHQLIIARTTDGVFDIDLRLSNVFLSARLLQMLGYGDRDMTAKLGWFTDLIHPEDRPNWLIEGREEQRRERELRLRHLDGSYHAYQVSTATVRGRSVRVLGTVTDVSARRKAEEERLALARELHDSVMQDLSTLGVYTDTARRALDGDQQDMLADLLARASEHARTTESSMRLLLSSLRADGGPSRYVSPHASTRALCDEFSVSAPTIQLTVSQQLSPEVRVCSKVAAAYAQILRESLRNIVKHAYATKAHVTASLDPAWLTLRVEDDGLGYSDADPIMCYETTGHYGIRGIKERVQALGGSLTLGSSELGGALLEARFPLGGRDFQPGDPESAAPHTYVGDSDD